MLDYSTSYTIFNDKFELFANDREYLATATVPPVMCSISLCFFLLTGRRQWPRHESGLPGFFVFMCVGLSVGIPCSCSIAAGSVAPFSSFAMMTLLRIKAACSSSNLLENLIKFSDLRSVFCCQPLGWCLWHSLTAYLSRGQCSVSSCVMCSIGRTFL